MGRAPWAAGTKSVPLPTATQFEPLRGSGEDPYTNASFPLLAPTAPCSPPRATYHLPAAYCQLPTAHCLLLSAFLRISYTRATGKPTTFE